MTGSILGSVPFNAFINDTDGGIECTLSKVADYTKLSGATEGRDANKSDQDKLGKWTQWDVQQFNRTTSATFKDLWKTLKYFLNVLTM